MLAREAERLGFQQVWVSDHYHNRHVHSALTQLALATKKVRLGPGVTNPHLVHPAVTASAIATLNEVSKGRALLGISSGDPFLLEIVGVKQRDPIICVRESIFIIQKLLRGQQVDFSGDCFSCHGAGLRFKPADKIPIYVGGRRRKMMQLAGETADGVLINASHPTDVMDAMKSVKQGLKSSGRSPRDFDFASYTASSIDKDLKKAREAARGVVAFIAASAPEESLAHRDIPAEDIEVVRGFLRKGEIAKAREAVTREMIDEFAVCGEVDELVSRVQKLKKLGATRIVIGSPIGPDSFESLKLIAKNLI